MTANQLFQQMKTEYLVNEGPSQDTRVQQLLTQFEADVRKDEAAKAAPADPKDPKK